jgi:putative nucleotidyltransferase with HDIG domain
MDTKTLEGVMIKNIDLKKFFFKTPQVMLQRKFNLKMQPKQEVLEEIDKRLGRDKKKAVISVWHKDKIKAGIVFSKKKDKTFNPGDLRIIESTKNIAESYFINQTFKEATLNFQKEIVFSLVEMLEIHDDYTKGHSEIVANLAKKFAEYLGLEEDDVNEIYWAALLHDIGKILVDQEILKKEKKLSIAEEEVVRKHALYGYAALNQSKATARIAKYVLYHHERYDGEGYPYGLKGKDIPLGSHIIFLADTYDAMGSERSYKDALNEEEIIEEIEKNLGSQYDPDIGRQFLKMLIEKSSDLK